MTNNDQQETDLYDSSILHCHDRACRRPEPGTKENTSCFPPMRAARA